MALLKILEFPDPRLRTIAEPVEQVDDEVRKHEMESKLAKDFDKLVVGAIEANRNGA